MESVCPFRLVHLVTAPGAKSASLTASCELLLLALSLAQLILLTRSGYVKWYMCEGRLLLYIVSEIIRLLSETELCCAYEGGHCLVIRSLASSQLD